MEQVGNSPPTDHADTGRGGPGSPRLTGELAIVTGGARRIGRAIATRIAREGADVIVHYRTSTKAVEATAEEIRGLDQDAWALQGDLASESDVETLVETAQDLAGRTPSVLVNNASVFPQEQLSDLTLATFLETVQTNAWAPLSLARSMAATGEESTIVNLLDARVGHPSRKRFAYALSKDLLASLTGLLAIELAPKVRVNAVAPGPVLPPTDGTSDDFEDIAEATPLGLPGEPDDVADAVVHLLAAYTTGAVVPVSGGQHLLPGVYHG